MRRREVVSLLIGATAWPLAARAQSNGRIPVIGVLRDVSEEDDRRLGLIAAFREGLRDLRYVEGETCASRRVAPGRAMPERSSTASSSSPTSWSD